jgi:lipopolysaccharide export system permease protein
LLKEKMSKGVKEHMFTEALGEVVVYVEKIDKESGEWQNVWVSDMRGVKNPTITMASTGRMESRLDQMMVSIILRNGSLHRPSQESAQIVQFDRYQINIPLLPPKSKATSLKKRTSYSMHELLAAAKGLKDSDESPVRYYIEFHRRLVLPVGCLMISLLGLPLGVQARPGRKAIGIQAGLAIFILYYVLFSYGKSLAEENVLPVVLAMWAPNCFFSVLAVFWIYRVANEQSLFPDSFTRFGRWLRKETSVRAKQLYRVILRFIGKEYEKEVTPEEEEQMALGRKKRIRGNAKSRVFHIPQCEYYDCRNCTLEFKNVRVALEAGFEPCRFCKDLISEND